MANPKDTRVFNLLSEMLGLQGEAFIGAVKEAVWVPGAVDQLADLIMRSLTPDDVAQLVGELPDEAEVMALIGRLLIGLNDHPDRLALGKAVITRAREIGSDAERYLSPYAWYPPVEAIEEIVVSPYRLHAASIIVRMKWGGQFTGIEAVWMIRYDASDVGEAYFVTDDAHRESFDEMLWWPISMDQALGLITAAGMLQSAVNERFPFESMTGVGLWMVLAGGREVVPWIDCAYALEHETLAAHEVVLAFLNALNNHDYLAAYALMDAKARPIEVLDYIGNKMQSQESGELWRLGVEVQRQSEIDAEVDAEGWYWVDRTMVRRHWNFVLGLDQDQHYRIQAQQVMEAEELSETILQQYLSRHPRYYAEVAVTDLEDLADVLDEPPIVLTEGVLYFSGGPEFDYRQPFDVGLATDLSGTILVEDAGVTMLLFHRDELSLRREIARLQDEEVIGEVFRTGTVTLIQEDDLKNAAADGFDVIDAMLQSFE